MVRTTSAGEVVIDVGELASSSGPLRTRGGKLSRVVVLLLVALAVTSIGTILWLFYEVHYKHDASVLRFGDGDVEDAAFVPKMNVHHPGANARHAKLVSSSTLSGAEAAAASSSSSSNKAHKAHKAHKKASSTSRSTASVKGDEPTAPPTPAPTNKTTIWTHETAAAIVASSRRDEVKEAFIHAWNGYVRCAWGHDELRPLSCRGEDGFGLGITIVDSLSTMWVMGLTNEFQAARDWVRDKMVVQQNRDVSVFETNIRVLGGLLSAYDLSQEDIFLKRAIEVGNVLLHAFDASSKMPQPFINLKSFGTSSPGWHGGRLILSEIGTLQLEFLHLSYHSKDRKYGDAAMLAIAQIIREYPGNVPRGLYPNWYSMSAPASPSGGSVSMGALGDSFYEYLLKVWLFTSRISPRLRSAFDLSVEAMLSHMIVTNSANLTFISELEGTTRTGHMDHLSCFSSGMLSLGAFTAPNVSATTSAASWYTASPPFQKTFNAADGIARVCVEMYRRTNLRLAGEAIQMTDSGLYVSPGGQYYLSRPETAEALFYLFRFTGDNVYREMALEIFEAIQKHTRVANGYSGVRNVQASQPELDDLMQSFLLAETFKYLYLILSGPELIPIDEYVFNTEAHPLRILKPNAMLEDIMKSFDKASVK